jgi:hypothetical protein
VGRGEGERKSGTLERSPPFDPPPPFSSDFLLADLDAVYSLTTQGHTGTTIAERVRISNAGLGEKRWD